MRLSFTGAALAIFGSSMASYARGGPVWHVFVGAIAAGVYVGLTHRDRPAAK